MKKIIKVTLSRVYEFETDKGVPEEQDIENAIELAYYHFSDELPYFENNPNDFVSHNVEIINTINEKSNTETSS